MQTAPGIGWTEEDCSGVGTVRRAGTRSRHGAGRTRQNTGRLGRKKKPPRPRRNSASISVTPL